MTFDIEQIRAANRVEQVFHEETGRELRRAGKEMCGLCPFHDDHNPSLYVNPAKQVWNCRSCGAAGDVFRFVMLHKGLDFNGALTDLAERRGMRPQPREATTEYVYQHRDGRPAYVIKRAPGKLFSTWRVNEDGSLAGGLDGVPRLLYRLPNLHAAPGDETRFVAEGEMDCDTLHVQGLVATTNPFGAGEWNEEFSRELAGYHVVVLPDNDKPGRQHAETVASSTHPYAASVKVIQLPGLSEKGDVTDWLRDGHTVDELRHLVEQAPLWSPGRVDHLAAPLPDADQEWPRLHAAAFHGVLGEIVNAIAPHTESDVAALLVQLLVGFGNVIGRRAHYMVESDRHFGNLFAVIVGESSRARKGTSSKRVRATLTAVDPLWAEGRVVSGLSSGEGLIAAVRDGAFGGSGRRHVREQLDEPAFDKRLLVMEDEFASTLSHIGRDGNVLSPTLRQAWDTGDLHVLTKQNPLRATGAHISVIGHITLDELRRTMPGKPEVFNGFANRFLWVCARRSKLLPFGGDFDPATLVELIARLVAARDAALRDEPIEMGADARDRWPVIYKQLDTFDEGVVGAVTSRSEAQVVRLALLYALADDAYTISSDHLHAALAVWRYCEASARFIFRQSHTPSGRLEDRLADALRVRRQMTRSEMREVLGNRVTQDEIDAALARLGSAVSMTRVTTGGRPAEVWTWVA
jgi:hypothetical protein